MEMWIAEALAQVECEEQANFLNRWARTVEHLSRNNNYGGSSMVQFYLAEHLEKGAVDFLEGIVSSWKYNREEYDRQTFKRNLLREEIAELEKAVGPKPKPTDGLPF